MGEKKREHKDIIGYPEGIRQFEGARHTWEDNINMDLK
jgi:hypothetical protein